MSDNQTQIDDLNRDFIVAVSVLGGVSLLLLSAVVGLIVWNVILTRRINNMDPLLNFKLKRPRLVRDVEELPRFAEDFHPPEVKEKQENLNPISRRSKTSFDHSNFSFSNPNLSNSYKNPDYMDLDSRFY